MVESAGGLSDQARLALADAVLGVHLGGVIKGGGGGGGGALPPPPPPSGSVAPTVGPAPSGPSPELQAFLDAIPFANDGDVITPDHHNTLRAALARIAGSLDESQFADVVTESLAPVLQAVIGQPSWRVTEGYSVGPAQGTDAQGWMPLDLPDGTNIDSLSVHGHTAVKPTLWSVAVRRKEISGSADPEDVVYGELQGTIGATAADTTQTFGTKTKDLTPLQAANLRLVDNSTYHYIFSTTLDSPQAGAVELRLVQVTCIRG